MNTLELTIGMAALGGGLRKVVAAAGGYTYIGVNQDADAAAATPTWRVWRITDASGAVDHPYLGDTGKRSSAFAFATTNMAALTWAL
jgi:hypothetical protein